jgi:hypothetical protein
MSPTMSAIVTSGVASFSTYRRRAQPGNGCLVTFRRKPRAACTADRLERIVVDLTTRHHRNLVIEQRHQRAEQTRLRLPAQSKQDEVVLRKEGVDELRHDGIVVAHNAGKERLARAKLDNQVLAHFLVHVAPRHAAVGNGATEIADRGNPFGSGHGWIVQNAQCGMHKAECSIKA